MYRVAVKIAFSAHKGQKDKGGFEYIGHPIRVANMCTSLESKTVAILHDTIEDSGWTRELLVDSGIPEHVAGMVDAMARRSGESYMDYIRRVAVNPVTREVKMADLTDNMDMSRLGTIGEEDLNRLKKYQKAYRFLQNYGNGKQ